MFSCGIDILQSYIIITLKHEYLILYLVAIVPYTTAILRYIQHVIMGRVLNVSIIFVVSRSALSMIH